MTITGQPQWETVEEAMAEPMVIKEGEQFIGDYLGVTSVDVEGVDKPIQYLLFREEGSGTVVSLSVSWKLRQAFLENSKVDIGATVRIHRLKDIPSRTPGRNDIKNYTVSVAK